jgi:hypothetical protein
MAAEDHLSDQQFDPWRWQQGECGTYACAVMRAKPGTKLGVAGYANEGGPEHGWEPQHFFAHDETHAYDSLGTHPLPYRGIHNQMDYWELGHEPETFGLPEDEQGSDVESAIQAAQRHARHLGQIK